MVAFLFSQTLLLPVHPAPATLAIILILLPCLLLGVLPRNLLASSRPKSHPSDRPSLTSCLQAVSRHAVMWLCFDSVTSTPPS